MAPVAVEVIQSAAFNQIFSGVQGQAATLHEIGQRAKALIVSGFQNGRNFPLAYSFHLL